jgi:hypothetical protein
LFVLCFFLIDSPTTHHRTLRPPCFRSLDLSPALAHSQPWPRPITPKPANRTLDLTPLPIMGERGQGRGTAQR